MMSEWGDSEGVLLLCIKVGDAASHDTLVKAFFVEIRCLRHLIEDALN
jgi:hypothetical protein